MLSECFFSKTLLIHEVLLSSYYCSAPPLIIFRLMLLFSPSHIEMSCSLRVGDEPKHIVTCSHVGFMSLEKEAGIRSDKEDGLGH